MSSELLGAGAVADRFGVSVNTVRTWESTGLLPSAYRVMPGERRVWRTEDVDTAEERIRHRRSGSEGDAMPDAA
ncbi:MAG: MerR family DNA-binding transcriptional regulator [Chloroflexia bacterium]|nr:MerR family DNA-binding transcriptional regulator [Chloroflexia bacterium]